MVLHRIRFFAFLSAVISLGASPPALADTCSIRPFSGPERQVNDAYIAYYGRPADIGGLGFWAGRLTTSGGDLRDIIQAFGVSAEFDRRFGGLDNVALIANLYRQLFGRDPDSAGADFYANALATGRLSLQSIALDVLNGARNDDAIILANRREAAEYFVACMEQGLIEYPPIEVAAGLLSSISVSGASIDAAIATIDALIDTPANQRPVAAPLTLLASSTIELIEIQLIAYDPDNDVIGYNLVSAPAGGGYVDAYIGSQTGRLYLTLDGSGDSVRLQYNATDGVFYSDSAEILVEVRDDSEDKGLGAEEIDAQSYASFTLLSPWGNLLGAPGADPAIPRAVDLSASFPQPGDQGRQGSCVGWATGYAMKSYFEKIDQGWDLSRQSQVFSPAYVFNPIALANCNGTYISQALDRIQTQGAATWSSMPYTDAECSTLPNATAEQEAANFRIRSWGTLRTVTDVKAQLANRRPVVVGINVFPSLSRLSGSNSVYTDYSGASEGGHAVTIVGYDDDRFGGAFKIINSWGTRFGDGGFFWLPYSALANSNVVFELYSVEDISQDYQPEDPVDPPPPPSDNLPNLEVLSWSTTYDPRPGGSGFLEYEIANTGTAIAPANAYVNLMLSADADIGNDDFFVVYEPVPFAMEPGGGAFRDASNRLRFYFPDNTPNGTFYMAVWVDDLDTVQESNEADNVSFGDLVTIEDSQPDLAVLDWYAEWVGNTGSLTYTVINQGSGTAPAGWDINLMLSDDQILGNTDDHYLEWETVQTALSPGATVYRDWTTPLYFNLFDVWPGYYFMALWIDDLDEVSEANERNNISWGWERTYISGFTAASGADAASPDQADADHATAMPRSQYNGRRPPPDAPLYQVRVTEDSDGTRRLEVLDLALPVQVSGALMGPSYGQEEALPGKRNAARNPRVFPVEKMRAMPATSVQ